MDKLEKMFSMQEELNTNVINRLGFKHYNDRKNPNMPGESYPEASPLSPREWADNYCSALQSETIETREALTQRPKWWKDKRKDDNGVKEEIVDQFHFVMSQALAMGMTAQELFDRYVQKNKENFTRKDWDVNK